MYFGLTWPTPSRHGDKTWVTLLTYKRRFSAVMPWKIQSVIGERWQLVKALLRNDKSLGYWCRFFGVSRKTAHKWKARFAAGGRPALHDRGRRPHWMPRRLAGKWIGRIKHLRRQHPHWGPRKMRAHFQRQGWCPPSARTIGRWVRRLGLTRPL